jgi:hypothetical protein
VDLHELNTACKLPTRLCHKLQYPCFFLRVNRVIRAVIKVIKVLKIIRNFETVTASRVSLVLMVSIVVRVIRVIISSQSPGCLFIRYVTMGPQGSKKKEFKVCTQLIHTCRDIALSLPSSASRRNIHAAT